MKRNREDIIVAAAAAAGPGAWFDPIQLQHLLFLIDGTVSHRIGGPFFRFEPHDYGPFDGAIHGVIRGMMGPAAPPTTVLFHTSATGCPMLVTRGGRRCLDRCQSPCRTTSGVRRDGFA